MWICSKSGFFSIVAHDKTHGQFLIRWRFAADSETVRKILPKAKIQKTPNADYAFRTCVSAESMLGFVIDLAAQINYPNFKNAAARNGQDAKLPAYHELWYSLRRAQLRESMGREPSEKELHGGLF